MSYYCKTTQVKQHHAIQLKCYVIIHLLKILPELRYLDFSFDFSFFLWCFLCFLCLLETSTSDKSLDGCLLFLCLDAVSASDESLEWCRFFLSFFLCLDDPIIFNALNTKIYKTYDIFTYLLNAENRQNKTLGRRTTTLNLSLILLCCLERFANVCNRFGWGTAVKW